MKETPHTEAALGLRQNQAQKDPHQHHDVYCNEGGSPKGRRVVQLTKQRPSEAKEKPGE